MCRRCDNSLRQAQEKRKANTMCYGNIATYHLGNIAKHLSTHKKHKQNSAFCPSRRGKLRYILHSRRNIQVRWALFRSFVCIFAPIK